MTELLALPHGLAAWAPQLAPLSIDLALAIAPWLGRLALAVGPMSAPVARRSGDPDGYLGIARRGAYERMLITEWGLADVVPDEFLRRAAMGEQLFFELARREPRGALRSIAIVSAGPSQIGAPRLAHLAALIVLARRAAAGGAGFSWGVLEDDAHELRDGLDEAAIRRLLAARTAAVAAPEAFAAWQAALPGTEREIWFVGDGEHASAARRAGAACLVVEDPLEPGRRAIDVAVQRRGAAIGLRLELPPPDVCARLLRNPFHHGSGAAAIHDAGPARDVRFAPDGRSVLVQLADRTILRWPIPNSPRDKPGSPRRLTPRPGRAVVALGIANRSVLAATATPWTPGEIEMNQGGNPPVRVILPDVTAATLATRLGSDGAPRIGACGFVRLGDRSELVLEIAGELLVVPGFSLWPPPGAAYAAVPLQPATGDPATLLATAFSPRTVVWAECGDRGPIRIVRATERGNQIVGHVGPPYRDDVRFGFAQPDGEPGWGTIAVAIDGERWAVATALVPLIALETTYPVVGACTFDGVPGLLTRPHPHRLIWQWPDRLEPLPTSATAIIAVAVCTQRPQLAWVTGGGAVVVYSMRHRAVLARLDPVPYLAEPP